MTPKVPGACSVCDREVREVKRRDPAGTPTAFGARLPGTRVAHLVHVDGSTSDHSLCATCEPTDLHTLWARACLLFAQGVDDTHDPRGVETYVANRPVGVLGYSPAAREAE